MTSRRFSFFLLTLLFFSARPAISSQTRLIEQIKDLPSKKRVAVIVQDEVRSWTKALTLAAMEEAIKNNGRFTLLTRSQLDSVLGELKIANSDLVDPKEAAKIGKALSAQYVVLVKCLRAENRTSEVGALGIKLKKTKMDCLFQLMLINTETTEILVSETVSKNKSTKSGFTGPYGISTSADPDSLKTYTEIMEGASVEFADKISLMTPLEGLVLQVKATEVIINGGVELGMAVGQEFEVVIEGDAIADETGNVVGYDRIKIALLQIVQVEPKLARCLVLQTFDTAGVPDLTPQANRVGRLYKVRQVPKLNHFSDKSPGKQKEKMN